MKHLKFVKFLVLAVLGLGLGFSSCNDEEGGESKADVVKGLYNMDAVSEGRNFYKSYNDPDKSDAEKIILAASSATKLYANKDDKVYETSFWVGVAAEKFQLGDDLDEASKKLDQLQELRDVISSSTKEPTETPEGSESAN